MAKKKPLLSERFSENAIQVLTSRYLLKDDNGQPVETIEEMFLRIAEHVASGEKNAPLLTSEYYTLLTSKKFFPNSPTFTGAGTPLGQLAACFVLPLSDDMGKNSDGIFQTLRNAALVQQTGGGNGFSFSQLRPAGMLVNTSKGQATGPIGFLEVFDKAFGVIAQGGTRRGANMAVLRIDHPDIEQFIACKLEEGEITNFNLSIAVTDDFMTAVEKDEEFKLRFPDITHDAYKDFTGDVEDAESQGIPIIVHKTVRAQELFDKIVTCAHKNGEPGLLFINSANKDNPVPNLYRLIATNPCGEQWLGPYESCCLGSVNLSEHIIKEKNQVDWEELEKTIKLATRFLDNVIDANKYVTGVPEIEKAAQNIRRIGLGIMGLADLLFALETGYNTEEGRQLAGSVMEFVRYHAMQASIELAMERGAFPGIAGSIYDPANLSWKPPVDNNTAAKKYGRPKPDWKKIVDGIKVHGIRNAAQTTIAPTGTIATVSDCEGYGCEPAFALAYTRAVQQKDSSETLQYLSPLFKEAIEKAVPEDEVRLKIIEKVEETGSCLGVDNVPQSIMDVFAVAGDIQASDHVLMQAALQRYVDNSISKTVNLPPNATKEDVQEAYGLAWKHGCKGITVYVAGSRKFEVLTVAESESVSDTQDYKQIWHGSKKPRPAALSGQTRRVETPLGDTFVTINENGGSQPFEVFVNTAKAGSDVAGVSEAIGRLASFILRLSSPVTPRKRLEGIYRQLIGIGGFRTKGFGRRQVRSLPDGIAQAISGYLDETSDWYDENYLAASPASEPAYFDMNMPQENAGVQNAVSQYGDLCPECGHAAVIESEGCHRCYACGYSQC